MNPHPWKRGDIELPDGVYEALVPLDGYSKGSRGGPRPYLYENDDGKWWVIVNLSDFGDMTIGAWGPMVDPISILG